MEGLEHVVAAGTLIGEPKLAPGGEIPYSIIPGTAVAHYLEDTLAAPVRTRATVRAASVETLCAYVNRFKLSETAIFADPEKVEVVAIIDYHAPKKPSFATHRISYIPPRALEWSTWKGANGKRMSQTDFAQFIEDNVVDIRVPNGADILEVSRNLQAKKSVQFSSAIRLADGAQEFTYAETVEGSSSKGKIIVPKEFKLGIPVFFGGALYEVLVRLRYRIDGGNLQLWYELYRPEHIERDAFAAIEALIAAQTEIVVWQGAP